MKKIYIKPAIRIPKYEMEYIMQVPSPYKGEKYDGSGTSGINLSGNTGYDNTGYTVGNDNNDATVNGFDWSEIDKLGI